MIPPNMARMAPWPASPNMTANKNGNVIIVYSARQKDKKRKTIIWLNDSCRVTWTKSGLLSRWEKDLTYFNKNSYYFPINNLPKWIAKKAIIATTVQIFILTIVKCKKFKGIKQQSNKSKHICTLWRITLHSAKTCTWISQGYFWWVFQEVNKIYYYSVQIMASLNLGLL